jgi:hypothetical protein
MTKKTDPGRIPGPAVIPACVEVVLFWTLANSRTGHNVLHGRNSGSFVPSVTSANSLFSAILTTWNSQLALYAPTTVVLGGLSVRDMSASTNAPFLNNTSGGSGTSASAAMPPQVALVLSGKGTMRGKGNSARWYLPGWASNADSGNGVVAPAVVTALGPFMTSVFSAFSTAGLVPCVAKPARQAYTGISGAQHPATTAHTIDIQAWALRDNIWDTVRARVKP